MSGLLVTGGAEANLVGVDFGSNPNPTPQNWTATTAANGSAPLTNLQNDSGTLTSVGLSVSGAPGASSAAPLATTIPQYSYSLTNIANNIYSFDAGGLFMVTISGLTTGQSYSVYVFGLRGGAVYSQTISLIGTNTVTFTQAGASDVLTVNDQVGSSSQNLSSYAKSITADSNGSIQVQVTGGSSPDGYFLAGIAIDEPVSASASIPSLSEWTQLLLALMLMTLIGWHFHRERSY